jgi:hypothetical protein
MERNDGKYLENEVATLVASMLASGRLPYRPELVKFRHKIKYYSATRNADVEFENVLEIYVKDNVNQPNAQPTHVIFFECKDHARNVEVGKVDEVVGRLNGSFGFNMKAYIITRKGFSKGAIATAQSHGIGLLKIMPDSKINFLMHMITLDVLERLRREFPKRAVAAIANENYVSDGKRFYAIDNGYAFDSLDSLIATHLRETVRGSTAS